MSDEGAPEDTSRVIIFDGLHNLRVYSKHGTVLSMDNVEILLDPNPEEKTLRIFVWKRQKLEYKNNPKSSRTVEEGTGG